MDMLDLSRIGYRLRASARGELLDYLDGTLPLLAAAPKPQARPQAMTGCPACQARRSAHAKAKAVYRAKHKGRLPK